MTDVTISGNTYQEQGSKPGPNHKDFIQFWTEGTGPSKGISITNNKFYSDDGSTHGIFMNGSDFNGGAFQDVYIANNYFKSSHIHGITVAHGNNVEIVNNTLIKDGKFPPLINVTPDSQNVKIIGNTAPSVPESGNSTWTVSGNKETGGGTHWTGGGGGAAIANTGAPIGAQAAAADADAAELGGDTFHLKPAAAEAIGATAVDLADQDALAGHTALDTGSDAAGAADADLDLAMAEVDQGAAGHKAADAGHDFLGL